MLDRPPVELMTAVTKLQALHRRKESTINQYISKMRKMYPKMAKDFKRPNSKFDELFQVDYEHKNGPEDCTGCDREQLLVRKRRTTAAPIVHYGIIGSANQVMRNGIVRERLRQETGILCFEMEAAGLMNNFPCLIIRGICDYSDTHKNKRWQPYAAGVAAAYAKALLEIMPTTDVTSMKEASGILGMGEFRSPGSTGKECAS